MLFSIKNQRVFVNSKLGKLKSKLTFSFND